MRILHSLFAVAAFSACHADHDNAHLGQLQLGLTSQAGDVTYRLSRAHFSLDGPEARQVDVEDQDEVELDLAAGSYRLTLAEGYALTRKDDPDAGAVAARLISQNPAPVLIQGGETVRATLRFELDQDASLSLGPGKLQVGIEVGASDAGDGTCVSGLRIDEVDYEQANTDDHEFIEVVNTGRCVASLEGVTLELVNGGDGKVYSRYALDEAASLMPGERVVIADPAVITELPATSKHLPLNGAGLQNGPDGMRLLLAERLLDAVAYEGPVDGAGEGDAAKTDDAAQSLSRCPDGFDTDDNALDFQLTQPSPGAASNCS